MLSRFSFHQQRRDKHPHTHPFAHFSTCEFLTLNTAEQDCCKEGAGSSNLTTLPFRKPITHVQSIACGPHTALESYKQGPGKNYKLFFKHHEFCFAFYNSFFKNWIAPVTSMNFTDDNIVLEGQKVSLPWPYTTACVRNQTLAPVCHTVASLGLVSLWKRAQGTEQWLALALLRSRVNIGGHASFRLPLAISFWTACPCPLPVLPMKYFIFFLIICGCSLHN